MPSCQLTTRGVGAEANHISRGRLQAGSARGAGSDSSPRATRVPARFGLSWCFRALCCGLVPGPRAGGRELVLGTLRLGGSSGARLAFLGCAETWCFGWLDATASPPASATLRGHPAPCSEGSVPCGQGQGGFHLQSLLPASQKSDPKCSGETGPQNTPEDPLGAGLAAASVNV